MSDCPGCVSKDNEIKWLREMLQSHLGGQVELPSRMEALADESEEPDKEEGVLPLGQYWAGFRSRHEGPLCSIRLQEEDEGAEASVEPEPNDSAGGGVVRSAEEG